MSSQAATLSRRRRIGWGWVRYALLIMVALFFIMPIYVMVVTALKPAAGSLLEGA